MLINSFNSEQFDRFENWRAANLGKASVRRVGSLAFAFVSFVC